MSFVKRRRGTLLLVILFGQLGWLLTMKATWSAVNSLGQAYADPHLLAYAICGMLLLVAGVVVNRALKQLDLRWLEWSPFGLRANVALAPIKRRWIGLPYALMLALCMPLLALIEEIIFRSGTTSWARALLWGGLAFGALHLLSFVSIRMVIWIGMAGVGLAALYMNGAGLDGVFVAHATYNLLALALLVAEQHLKNAPGFVRRVTERVAAAN
jgi:membrane protease YdiL (CAAX protease family)